MLERATRCIKIKSGVAPGRIIKALRQGCKLAQNFWQSGGIAGGFFKQNATLLC